MSPISISASSLFYFLNLLRQKWRIEAQPQYGEDIYTYVESPTDLDRSPELLSSISEFLAIDGWTCPETVFEQVGDDLGIFEQHLIFL